MFLLITIVTGGFGNMDNIIENLKMNEVDQTRDSVGPPESETSSSNQIPSAYYSTRTSFCQDSNESHNENESISLNCIPVNGNNMIGRDETEETMLDGSCDDLGKAIHRNNRMVNKI